MRLYAITGRRMYPGDERQRCAALVRQAGEWARGGVELIQVREKDLEEGLLLDLAGAVVEAVRGAGGAARVVVNGSAAVARAAGADGVHLPGPAGEDGGRGDAGAGEDEAAASLLMQRVLAVRRIWAGRGSAPLVSAACHSADEVACAARAGAGVVVFAPVWEKTLEGEERLPGVGLEALRAACAAGAGTPVFALGGVDAGNAGECVLAGAAGVAGIRLFAGEAWRGLVG